ncbi:MULTISPECIES: DUF2092 domain-containing protein [unclassified Synechocystis]|uniref:DUF2092 domain-containing protein n=1 Tax=unclassified Synechocystis TaxID=2640012 RepID=UPI0003FABC86|nr:MULTISPECIES: DUF2092 domain-containing protein [unclassified Synechocystis]AIE74920.1 hypothetical protein D082_23920 [Synechocystis sp. PCC 6714]MCT0253366.1 DUF2092 domain-containing protein [Synechocystis sp. CS-94]
MLKIISTLTISLGIFGAFPLLAQTPTPQTKEIVRTTDQLIDQVCDFIQSQKTFSVDMAITYDELLEIGSKVQYSANQKLLVEKPNRLRSDYVGDERVTNFYYDGKNFTLQAPNLGFYNTKPAPNTLDGVLDQIESKYGITLPMSNLFASNPCGDLKAETESSFFVGNNLVGNEETYQILLQGEDRDFQMWISQGEQPVLKKAIITYKNLPGEPQYTVAFFNWNFKPEVPSNAFVFTPTKDDVMVEFIPLDQLSLPPENQ